MTPAYDLFALLFAIAVTLAPNDDSVALEPIDADLRDRILFVREAGAVYRAELNGRDFGRFERSGEHIVHHTGIGSPTRYLIGSLVDPASLSPSATALPLRGEFAPAIIRVVRSGGTLRLVDPSAEVLSRSLRLVASTAPRQSSSSSESIRR